VDVGEIFNDLRLGWMARDLISKSFPLWFGPLEFRVELYIDETYNLAG
jgi:hypothetical protein